MSYRACGAPGKSAYSWPRVAMAAKIKRLYGWLDSMLCTLRAVLALICLHPDSASVLAPSTYLVCVRYCLVGRSPQSVHLFIRSRLL
jgi:hypothetical protein